MKLEGSCQCGGVTFTVETSHPVPYQRCYCSICRKIQGGGGYAINLAGDFRTLKVKGEDRITRYHAKMHEPGRRTTRSKAERSVAALPAGAGCDAVIARYRAVVKSDADTGNVNQSVYAQIDGEIRRAEAACSAGRDAEARSLIAASKAGHGYPGGA